MPDWFILSKSLEIPAALFKWHLHEYNWYVICLNGLRKSSSCNMLLKNNVLVKFKVSFSIVSFETVDMKILENYIKRVSGGVSLQIPVCKS